MVKKFDLIVIGAGSGLHVAAEAVERGLKVAVVEEGPMGGTCLNRGCIPSKMVIHSADVADEIRRSHLFGIQSKIQSINFKKVTQRASREVDSDARMIEKGIKSTKGETLFKGRGKFIAPYTLQVGRNKIKGKRIVIAAGARPFIPPIEGIDNVPFMTSTQALRQTKLPKSLIVIGGGYIGVEMGHFYASMGCNVTIVQRGPLLIPREDEDVAQLFTKLWKKKYNVLTNASANKVEQKGKKIIVTVKQGTRTKKITAEKLLVATGVRPNSDTLDLEKTGVKTTKRGFIKVNKYMQTNKKNIWALGDIAGIYLFKHSANLEAEYVTNNLFGKKKAVDYYPMPHAIFTNPQVAGVGLTEQQAVEKKIKFSIGKYEYKNTGMGSALEEKDGFVKIIAKGKEILGCHIIGPHASTLIHQVVIAMKANRKKSLEILQNAVHVHPALNEVVQRASWRVS